MVAKKSVVGLATVASAALAFGLGLPSAGASPSTGQSAHTMAEIQQAAITQASTLDKSLGTASGGVFLDNGRAVVNVTNAAAADKVRAAGMTAKQVKYSFATLTNTKNTMDAVRDVPQTSWGIDTRTNKVVVTIYSAATKATEDKVTAAATKLGDKVRIEHQAGRLDTHIRGGDAIQNGLVRCSLGFNVIRNGAPFLLTAGHCTNEGGTWSGGDVTGATVVESDAPGADSGLLTRPNGTGPGQINTGQVITSAGTPFVGEQMQDAGSTTGHGSGTITSVDQSVNFDIGVINHEFGTTAHTEPGDSGGPAYDGSTGLGTLTGGNAVTSFFYPLQREIQMYGLTLA